METKRRWSLAVAGLAWLLMVPLVVAPLLRAAPQDAAAQEADPAAGQDDQPAEKESEDGEEKKKSWKDILYLDQEPFDLLILDAENKNAELQIFPVEEIPSNPRPTDRLRITLVDYPDRKFDVAWEHITELKTYHTLLFEEAARLTADKKFNEAFRNYAYLKRQGANIPGIQQAMLEFLFANASDAFENQQDEYALSLLEQLHDSNPGYRRRDVMQALASVADRLIQDYADLGDYRNARGLIQRLSGQYDASAIPTLGQWRDRLISMATEKKQQAETLVAQGDLREAEKTAREMIKIWPTLAGASELALNIARQYPMVIVGVSLPATDRGGVRKIDNWASRRAGYLTERTLLEFIGAGPEGGQYMSPLGEFDQSDDRRQLTLDLRQPTGTGPAVTGYDVARRLLDMAEPTHPDYMPGWSALTSTVEVQEVYRVSVNLRQPHVLPEAMLQIVLDPDAAERTETSPSDGPYVLAEQNVDQTHFLVNSKYRFSSDTHPEEIVERRFEDPQDAAVALRRGDIDVLDRVFPADVLELQASEEVVVATYALPTVHFLVPNYDKPYTSSQTFRRAIAFGINRQAILDTELLGNVPLEGYQVISGPFPAGIRETDPLSYAYNPRISPRTFYPRLSRVLQELAKREQAEMARKRKEPEPEIPELVLAYPADEMARVACQSISQYLQMVGIACRLKALPPGATSDADGEADLTYVQVAMWEPVIDARRLLGSNGIAQVGNEYVGMALRSLDKASNWRDARDRLHELHRIVHEQVAVIPLWQTVDYFAYRKDLAGIRSRPVTLYQDVEQWQVTARAPRQ